MSTLPISSNHDGQKWLAELSLKEDSVDKAISDLLVHTSSDGLEHEVTLENGQKFFVHISNKRNYIVLDRTTFKQLWIVISNKFKCLFKFK